MNCDKKKYGNLVEDLENTFTFGDNKYPETQQKSYEYAMNYKKFKPKTQQNSSRRDGLAFATAGRGGRGNGGRGNGRPRRCYGNRCYGNCDNEQCTAPA